MSLTWLQSFWELALFLLGIVFFSPGAQWFSLLKVVEFFPPSINHVAFMSYIAGCFFFFFQSPQLCSNCFKSKDSILNLWAAVLRAYSRDRGNNPLRSKAPRVGRARAEEWNRPGLLWQRTETQEPWWHGEILKGFHWLALILVRKKKAMRWGKARGSKLGSSEGRYQRVV